MGKQSSDHLVRCRRRQTRHQTTSQANEGDCIRNWHVYLALQSRMSIRDLAGDEEGQRRPCSGQWSRTLYFAYAPWSRCAPAAARPPPSSSPESRSPESGPSSSSGTRGALRRVTAFSGASASLRQPGEDGTPNTDRGTGGTVFQIPSTLGSLTDVGSTTCGQDRS